MHLCTETRRCSGKDKLFLQRVFFLNLRSCTVVPFIKWKLKDGIKDFLCYSLLFSGSREVCKKKHVPSSNLTSSNNIISYVGLLMLFFVSLFSSDISKRKSLKLADKSWTSNSSFFPQHIALLKEVMVLYLKSIKLHFKITIKHNIHTNSMTSTWPLGLINNKMLIKVWKRDQII